MKNDSPIEDDNFLRNRISSQRLLANDRSENKSDDQVDYVFGNYSKEVILLMNRVVFVIRLRGAIRKKHFLGVSSPDRRDMIREIVKGKRTSEEGIFCDFIIQYRLKDGEGDGQVSSALETIDTVEDLLELWMQYIPFPYGGIGFTHFLDAYHLLLDHLGYVSPDDSVSAITINSVSSIMSSSPFPYHFRHFALPPRVYDIVSKQFSLLKAMSSSSRPYWILNVMANELDIESISNQDTKLFINKQIEKAVLYKKLIDSQNTLRNIWMADTDIDFSVGTIQTLIRMDSSDLSDTVESITSPDGFEEVLSSASSNLKNELDERINWV